MWLTILLIIPNINEFKTYESVTCNIYDNIKITQGIVMGSCDSDTE